MSEKVIYRSPTYKVSQWLQILKEPWRTRAIEEWRKSVGNGYSHNKEECGTAHGALACAIIWGETIEGFSYWCYVYTEMRDNMSKKILNKYIQPKYHWVFKAKINQG